MNKKLNRRDLHSNIGDLHPEIKAPKGNFQGWERSQIDRWQDEAEGIIAEKRVRRTLHKAGRYNFAKTFL
jgi:hypothetical protein